MTRKEKKRNRYADPVVVPNIHGAKRKGMIGDLVVTTEEKKQA